MSVVDDFSNEPNEQLAVLYCDLSRSDTDATAEYALAHWRMNYFREAREVARDHGGEEAITSAGGWIATFRSTVEALLCAHALSSLAGWQRGGPSLSGGLSAGQVVRQSTAIGGSTVQEAITLCRWARPRQVLIADPLKVVVASDAARSLAPSPREALIDAEVTPHVSEPRGALGQWPSAGRQPLGGGPLGHYRRPSAFRRRVDSEHPNTGPSLRLLTTDTSEIADTTAPTCTVDTTTTEIAATTGATATTTGATAGAGTHSPTGPGVGANTPAGVTTPADHPAAAAALRLTVLGWVQLEAGEPPVPQAVLRGTQARAVLCMLALRRGPVHKQELAELVWPASLPEHWDGALRGIITKIRRFLAAGGLGGREVLVGEGGYYELRLPAEVTVDRNAVTALIAGAQQALAGDHPDEASSLAHRAEAILQRKLLSGPDHAWFDQVRSELATERLTALELCARADLAIGAGAASSAVEGATGALEAAKRAATGALALDRYRESSYRLLMQAHSAAGSRGEALRTYEQCRRMLADELGVGPAPQTQALYIHLLG